MSVEVELVFSVVSIFNVRYCIMCLGSEHCILHTLLASWLCSFTVTYIDFVFGIYLVSLVTLFLILEDLME
jgi:hypothetical protein